MIFADLNPESDVLLVGIAGGSGSGKNLYVEEIKKNVGEEYVTVVDFDIFYRDLSSLAFEERRRKNFDHPDSLDENEAVRVLTSLKQGQDTEGPIYSFKTHTVTGEKIIKAKKIIIVNGILIFHLEKIRDLFDLRIYIETDASIRLSRRAERDVNERGRTYPDVLDQWEKTVFPMHILYVKPSKIHAHIIIPNTQKGTDNTVVATTVLCGFLKNFVHVQSKPSVL